MNDIELISKLSSSFSQQLLWYRELSDNAQKTLSRLVMSRGDVTAVMPNFERKQALLDEIALERKRIESDISVWQERKNSIPESKMTQEMNALLITMEECIKSFLSNEEQIMAWVKHAMNAAATVEQDI